MKVIKIKDKALDIGLIKWPAMVVEGKKISEEQAAEILIRTDSHMPDFTYAGNSQRAGKRINDLFGLPTEKLDPSNYRAHYNAMERLGGKLNILELGYLNNNRIISSYVGGPHGWCDWGGNIFCNSYNIGKWPDVEDVAKEWGTIASRFPFLDLKCVLFNGEQCEQTSRPVVEFVVKNGQVVVSPAKKKTQTLPDGAFSTAAFTLGLSLPTEMRESGISFDDLVTKLHRLYGNPLPQYRDFLEEE